MRTLRAVRTAVLLAGVALCARAATLDVSSAAAVTVETGDRLFVNFGIWTYSTSEYPVEIAASLSTAFSGFGGALFQARVESAAGAASFDFSAPRGFSPGFWDGGGYAGATGAVYFSRQISPADAAIVFGAGPIDRSTTATLIFENTGAAAVLGIPGVEFRRTLSVTLGGGGRTVSADAGRVCLETAPQLFTGSAAFGADAAPVPEPDTWLEMWAGSAGALYLWASGRSWRVLVSVYPQRASKECRASERVHGVCLPSRPPV